MLEGIGEGLTGAGVPDPGGAGGDEACAVRAERRDDDCATLVMLDGIG
jgi:hypothetical protein